jgi:hypothetical protein
MSTTTIRCWAFVHADGPTKGHQYERGEGAPHFPSRDAAIDWRDSEDAHPAIDLVQLPEVCHIVTCDGCGRSPDGEFFTVHHFTRSDAIWEARDSGWSSISDDSWLCLTCT